VYQIVGNEDWNGDGSNLSLISLVVAEILTNEMREWKWPKQEIKNKFYLWYKIYSRCPDMINRFYSICEYSGIIPSLFWF
jgi:hypothetical protein